MTTSRRFIRHVTSDTDLRHRGVLTNESEAPSTKILVIWSRGLDVTYVSHVYNLKGHSFTVANFATQGRTIQTIQISLYSVIYFLIVPNQLGPNYLKLQWLTPHSKLIFYGISNMVN